MRKYILSALTAIFAVLWASAEEMVTVYSLYVNTVSGDQIEYAFEKKPVATFEGDNLIITVTDAPGVEYPMNEVKNITIQGKEESGVAESENVKYQIRITDSYITVKGLAEPNGVEVYSLSGVLVGKGAPDQSGNCEVSIENLAQGVYVVSLPGHSFKFVK
ncbi:MAG: hypothetical protein K2H96_06585 [Muribaculaceae bacterium]|nr:hypothetical protein [Muribaculaceae bacterium]